MHRKVLHRPEVQRRAPLSPARLGYPRTVARPRLKLDPMIIERTPLRGPSLSRSGLGTLDPGRQAKEEYGCRGCRVDRPATAPRDSPDTRLC